MKEIDLITYLENLPKRREIKFSKDFQSDDYFTALGQVKNKLFEILEASERSSVGQN